MSLIEDIKRHYAQHKYAPSADELDWEMIGGKWVETDTVTEEVFYEVLNKVRWGMRFVQVYKRGDEYVAVKDITPATEMQDWGDYGDPEIYHVRPVEVTVTRYERVVPTTPTRIDNSDFDWDDI